MSFSGKKYRRTRCENIDEIVKISNSNENLLAILKCKAPTFSFTRINKDLFNFTMTIGDKVMQYDFKLGEEQVRERLDGAKVKMTYTLESDNVLKQKIIQKEGKIVHFRREFGEKDAKMTITVEGTNVEAKVYYELVE